MLLTWLSPLTRTDEKAQDERLAIKVQSREGKKKTKKRKFRVASTDLADRQND